MTGAVGRRDIELLYDEFDASDGIWITGYCSSSKGRDEPEGQAGRYYEVSVRFAAFKLNVTPAGGRFDNGEA